MSSFAGGFLGDNLFIVILVLFILLIIIGARENS